MIIDKLSITNFKVFKKVSFTFNHEMNIFTGINNSGKTTVLEAIALWSECFNKLIKQVKRKDASLALQNGDFRLGDKSQNYFNFEDIVSIRSPYYDDIFYNLDKTNVISIEMIIKNGADSLTIGFQISNARGSNYEIKLLENSNFSYPRFNNFFNLFPNPINTVFASPIANLLINEEFVTDPIIKEYISRRESIKVLRNRLYNLSDDTFLELEKSISFILNNEIKLETQADKKRDTKIDYDITLNQKDILKNISLVGSGTIQIIEILLSIFDTKKELNIILLDEPDSHIHRDIQKRLIKVLLDYTRNTQIFITTHNESLIRNSKPEYIFHLEGNEEKGYFPISYNVKDTTRKGLQPSRQIKVLQSLGSESSLDFINALESQRLFLVEGKSDPLNLDIILDKKYQGEKQNNMYWSFDGVENIFKHIISTKELFSLIKNEKTLWEKSILILDRDYFTDMQANKLQKELQTKLKIPVYIWNCYTLESVVLTDIDKFSKLLYTYIRELKECREVDIKGFIEIEIQNIIKDKKELLNDRGIIVKWIKDKRESLSKNNLSNNILVSETAYSDIKEYHLDKLNNNDLSSLGTKEDIDLIIQNALNSYEIKSFISFDELISLVDISTYFEEWNRMVNAIIK